VEVAANLMGGGILVNHSLNSEIGNRNIQARYLVRYVYGRANFRVCVGKNVIAYLLTYLLR